MKTHLSLLGILLSLFILTSAFCISFPISAQGLLKVSSTLDGVESEYSGAATIDLGSVGTVSFKGGVSLIIEDLLEPERLDITCHGGFSFDTPSAFSLAFGDLSGIPAIRLLLDPHGFPAGSSIQSLQKELKITPISLDPADESTFTVGLATKIPLGSLGAIFPFFFTPLLNRANSRGGGAEVILYTPTGFLTVGASLAGRSLDAEPTDRLFYGGYPSQRGLFLQFSMTMLSHRFNLPVVGIGEWISRIQIFSMHDTSLGQGVSYSSHMEIKFQSCSLNWDIQRLPIVMGTLGIGNPKVDTSILQEMQLELISVAGPVAVTWNVTDKIWRNTPYASDYQKRTVSTLASLDFAKTEVTLGCDFRSEASWMENGVLKRNGSLDLRLGLQVDDVYMLLKPSLSLAEKSSPKMKLDCTIRRSFHNGIVWEAAIDCRNENIRIVLCAVYEREGAQIKVTCDSLRKVSISLTIGR